MRHRTSDVQLVALAMPALAPALLRAQGLSGSITNERARPVVVTAAGPNEVAISLTRPLMQRWPRGLPCGNPLIPMAPGNRAQVVSIWTRQ